MLFYTIIGCSHRIGILVASSLAAFSFIGVTSAYRYASDPRLQLAEKKEAGILDLPETPSHLRQAICESSKDVVVELEFKPLYVIKDIHSVRGENVETICCIGPAKFPVTDYKQNLTLTWNRSKKPSKESLKRTNSFSCGKYKGKPVKVMLLISRNSEYEKLNFSLNDIGKSDPDFPMNRAGNSYVTFHETIHGSPTLDENQYNFLCEVYPQEK